MSQLHVDRVIRTRSPVEPDVPSELDTTHYRVGSRIGDKSPELDDPLIGVLVGIRCRNGEGIPRIFQVLAVGIVDGRFLSLDIAVSLHRVGEIVIQWWIKSRIGQPRGKASSQVCRLPGRSSRKRYLCFHSSDFVPGVQRLEGLELRVRA